MERKDTTNPLNCCLSCGHSVQPLQNERRCFPSHQLILLAQTLSLLPSPNPRALNSRDVIISTIIECGMIDNNNKNVGQYTSGDGKSQNR